jgi:hypothetical protein
MVEDMAGTTVEAGDTTGAVAMAAEGMGAAVVVEGMVAEAVAGDIEPRGLLCLHC